MAEPIPRRRRWLKRISIGVVATLLIVFGLRCAWGMYAQRRLAAVLEEYRAAGEPVWPDDFAVAHIPAEQNAAEWLKKAAAALVSGRFPNGLELADICSDPLLVLDYPAESSKMMADNATALQHIRAARAAPACDWAILPEPSSFNATLGVYSNLRSLAKTACAAAACSHLRGDDAAAVELLLDSLAIAARTEEAGSLLISVLVSISIESMTAGEIEFIAGRLRNDGDLRTRINALINVLLDEKLERAVWQRAMHGERAFLLKSLDDMCAGTSGAPGVPSGWGDRAIAALLAPRWKLAAIDSLERLSRMADADVDDWHRTRSKFVKDAAATTTSHTAWQFWLNPLSDGTSERVLELRIRDVVSKRLAATALALRLYELDHGRRPSRLEELVPDYLTGVPRDPFGSANAPLRYVADDEAPRLYCVGTDGEDNGGVESYSSSGWRVAGTDVLFQLDRKNIKRPKWGTPSTTTPTGAPASQQSLKHDPEVEDDEGGNGE